MFFSVQQGLLQSGGHLSASFLAVQHGLSQFTGQALVCSAAPTEAPLVAGPKREPMSNAPAITAAIMMNIRSIFLRFIRLLPAIFLILLLLFLVSLLYCWATKDVLKKQGRE